MPRSRYQRWRKAGPKRAAKPRSAPLLEVLACEQQVIVAYALKYPEVRHREGAWKMLDDGVCAVAPAGFQDAL